MLTQGVCFPEEPQPSWFVLSQHVQAAGHAERQRWPELVLLCWHCRAGTAPLLLLALPKTSSANTPQQSGAGWEPMETAKTSLGDCIMQRQAWEQS